MTPLLPAPAHKAWHDQGAEGAAVLEAVQPAAPLKTADAQALRLMCCVCCAGLNRATRAMARTSAVINACSPLAIAPIEVPRYRAVNEEVVKLDLDFGDAFLGVLVDREDRLRALWASYSEQVRSAPAIPPVTLGPSSCHVCQGWHVSRGDKACSPSPGACMASG